MPIAKWFDRSVRIAQDATNVPADRVPADNVTLWINSIATWGGSRSIANGNRSNFHQVDGPIALCKTKCRPVEYDPERNDFRKQAAEAESKAQLTTDPDLKRSWRDRIFPVFSLLNREFGGPVLKKMLPRSAVDQSGCSFNGPRVMLERPDLVTKAIIRDYELSSPR